VHRGINASRLSETSFGETLPIASETINGEDDSIGRHMNRRVEFRLISQELNAPVVAYNSAGRQTLQKPVAQMPVETGKQPDVDRNGKTSDNAGEFAIIVHYSFDKAVINNSYYRSLDTLAQLMQASPSHKLMVNGHTDTRGSDAYNLQLADERVKSCIKYLVKKGIAKDRLTGSAYGECCPVAQETVNGKDDPQARWMNRRVEFKWLKE
jgi:outer membrane protein OmpA-like peptidoglycan-associated protein